MPQVITADDLAQEIRETHLAWTVDEYHVVTGCELRLAYGPASLDRVSFDPMRVSCGECLKRMERVA